MRNTTKYKSLIQLIKYATVGGIATGINYIIFLLLFNYYHVHYVVSSALAFISSILVGFFIHKYWTFRLYKSAKKIIIKYFVVYCSSLILSLSILHFLVEKFVYHPQWANVISIAFTALFNYLGFRFYVFKK